ncbi:hypothetical protein HFP15_32425 [Amycolatopsis sp. K13G38]|uniref:DUF418 domain-containing protein n=1 Tax=Amycolatopsis acididurans TaxID=2724524 RepID=A0ABX1JFE8_9PSEU|nr:hypothetical protein [Amycolatopsis acididurans]NKQ57579.1 hypothetical protein [Amycolatopsis acididurans]
MLTLRFLWSWTKITALTVLAVVIEHAMITGFWGFALAAGITVTVWLVITVGLYREWRAHGTGYRHEVSEWVTGRPDRRRI